MSAELTLLFFGSSLVFLLASAQFLLWKTENYALPATRGAQFHMRLFLARLMIYLYGGAITAVALFYVTSV